MAATLPPLRKALAIQRNLLAALTGRPASEEPPEIFRLTDLRLPTDLPLSVPSQLIEQRPDVRAAEEQLHSASAQVGVAIANMLPNFTITETAVIRPRTSRRCFRRKPVLDGCRQCDPDSV